MENINQQSKTAFAERLRSGRGIILDGGLSNQLEQQGFDLNNPLWSAVLLKQQPAAIIEAHRHYLEAGADCIITASYQASIPGFEAIGISREEASRLITLSVSLAQTAIEEYLKKTPDCQQRPMVAASIGPYGAALADGSEYRGNYAIGDDKLREFHQQRLQLLDQTDADILACETIPSMQEARVLHGLLLSVKTDAWFSFSCRDGQHLNDGTSIEEAVGLFSGHPKVLAIGVNCTAPQYMEEIIGRIHRVLPDKAIIVYPNSGEQYDPDTKNWHGISSPGETARAAISWSRAGATIIGGCCRMGPSHIREIKQQLTRDLNHDKNEKA